MARTIDINRAPVLTLWAAVVAERLGFARDEALTMGRVVAGLNAYAKGKALGIFQPRPKEVADKRRRLAHGEEMHVDLIGRAVPVTATSAGLRAVSKGKPVDPASVERYLAAKFGAALEDARQAMALLAKSRKPQDLAREAYRLYEAFRPEVPAGTRGWGAAGRLDLGAIAALADRSSS